MPSFRGLSCFIRTEKAHHQQSKKGNEQRETEVVPEVYSWAQAQNNAITSVIAPQPSWFEICLEVLEYISEHLVVEVTIDGRARGSIVNQVVMKEESFKEHSKVAFAPIGGVQYLRPWRAANPPYAWIERAWRFDDLHRARTRAESGPDPSGLGTIVVRIRKAARVVTTNYHTQLVRYSHTHGSQDYRYARTIVTDQGARRSGITHLVVFGPEKKSNDNLLNGRNQTRLTDTFEPIDRFTWCDDGIKPYAEFRFQYRSPDIFIPGSLSKILGSVPLALQSTLLPSASAAPAAQRTPVSNQPHPPSGISRIPVTASTVPAPSIAPTTTETPLESDEDIDAAISKLQNEAVRINEQIKVQKQRKAAKERRAKKEILRKRQADMAKRQSELAKQQKEIEAEMVRLDAEMKELSPEDEVEVKTEVEGE